MKGGALRPPAADTAGSADPRELPIADDEAGERHAGAEAPRKRRRKRRRRLFSPLTGRILLLNLLVLLVPIFGLLHLSQYRASLIDTELNALATQGRAFSVGLGTTAVVVTQTGEERLLPELARHLMRVVLLRGQVRARLFAPSGELLIDSYLLNGAGAPIVVEPLPPPGSDGILKNLSDELEDALGWLPGTPELPTYLEDLAPRAEDYGEVAAALSGETGGRARLDEDGRLVLSAAVPIQRYRQVLGAILLTKNGASVEAAVSDRRQDILIVLAAALALTVLVSLYLSGTLARPIHRLAEAADMTRYGKGRRIEIPDFTGRHDEIGDLSAALREMTEALWQRLDAIEGFAADVSHEIKNPLTSLRSAVETVARVKDPEQQKHLMSIILDDVQRLDRLISDISDASRLDAELSRAETEKVDVASLLSALTQVHEAAASSRGINIKLDLRPGESLWVNAIEGRLGQVFRNLIANAISFSPAGGTIRLSAWRESHNVHVTVSDEGPGIPEEKLEAIFDRFYSERPQGEKFGTHSGLGLSISRQIVTALGGGIRAENRKTVDGVVAGARFHVRLPVEAS